MNRARAARWAGAAAGVLFLGLTASAGATPPPPTLKGDYQLQGSYASSVGGAPTLADIGTGNAFGSDTVNGASRQVLSFPIHNGLALDSSGLVNPFNHSVVMLFRLDTVTGYRRLLDFSSGTSDSGLYVRNGTIDVYTASVSPSDHQSAALVSPNTYVEVAVANAGPQPLNYSLTTVYLNGAQVFSDNTADGFDISSGQIRFFKDDLAEESGGAVACIRVYNGYLQSEDVAQIAADPAFCPAAQAPPDAGVGDTTPPNTKLKRHPKKRSADETPTFKFVSTEPGSTFTCRIDHRKPKDCRSPFTTKRLKAGRHKFRVDAVDPAGNADPSPAKFKFTVLP